jgi:hypothetical protein
VQAEQFRWSEALLFQLLMNDLDEFFRRKCRPILRLPLDSTAARWAMTAGVSRSWSRPAFLLSVLLKLVVHLAAVNRGAAGRPAGCGTA